MTGKALIKKWEGLKLDAYLCPAGVPTIGYGHTKDVHLGMSISVEEAERFLEEDMLEAEKGIKKLVKVDLTENQMGALISFVFNLGLGNFAKSTLLKVLNQGKFMEASNEFPKWNKVKGVPSVGLTNRRLEEKALFNKQ